MAKGINIEIIVGPNPFEVKCVEPGKWLIEGWTVTRFSDGSRWYAVKLGQAFTRQTLSEVRDEIAERASEPS